MLTAIIARADHLSGLTYPSWRKVGYLRDTTGRISAVTHHRQHGHHPFGRQRRPSAIPSLTGLSFGNNLAPSRSFDNDYWLSGQTAGSLQSLGYAYDPAGNLTGITGNSSIRSALTPWPPKFDT